MKLRARLLRVVTGGCGPATKATLRGIARAHGLEEEFDDTFGAMLVAGQLVMFGDKRGARYGVSKRRQAA
jgi:hypothetical protein